MIQMDEIHITVLVPRNLPQQKYDRMYKTLHRSRFLARLKRTIQKVFHRRASLKGVKIRLSR